MSGESTSQRHLGPGPEPTHAARWAGLYEHAPCGLVSLGLDGTLVAMNATFARWLGIEPREEFLGRRFAELLAPGDRIYFETHCAPLLQMQGEIRAIAVSLVRADGKWIPCMLNATLSRGADGGRDEIQIALFDATDRRKYEEELLRANAATRQAEERASTLASTLQASLLPPALPKLRAFDVGGAYHPVESSMEVGGDFYDVFEAKEGDWAVLVGDVSGKGAAAASMTAHARYAARGAAIATTRPSAVLGAINHALVGDPSDRYCTAAYATLLDRPTGVHVRLSLAGHPHPLLVRPDGDVLQLGRPGMMLGVFDHVVLHDDLRTLEPEDVVVFYTDGLTDGRNGREFFGEERLRSALRDLRRSGAQEIASALVDRVVTFQKGWLRDDVAVVALKVLPSAEGAQ